MSKEQIWKFGPLYPGLKWKDLDVPEYAEIVHFGIQNDMMYFWAHVDTTAALLARQFMVIPTGLDIPEGGLYHGSVIARDSTVWHLYERA
jgi:hypothetical protein